MIHELTAKEFLAVETVPGFSPFSPIKRGWFLSIPGVESGDLELIQVCMYMRLYKYYMSKQAYI